MPDYKERLLDSAEFLVVSKQSLSGEGYIPLKTAESVFAGKAAVKPTERDVRFVENAFIRRDPVRFAGGEYIPNNKDKFMLFILLAAFSVSVFLFIDIIFRANLTGSVFSVILMLIFASVLLKLQKGVKERKLNAEKYNALRIGDYTVYKLPVTGKMLHGSTAMYSKAPFKPRIGYRRGYHGAPRPSLRSLSYDNDKMSAQPRGYTHWWRFIECGALIFDVDDWTYSACDETVLVFAFGLKKGVAIELLAPEED